MPKLPFEVNRHSGTDLTDQVVDGFRAAILSERIRQGERLPSRENVARMLGVSVRVAREAFARLAAESLVSIRPRIGCEVLARREMFWRRRVVAVMPALYQVSYYISVVMSEVQRRLSSAGCLFECIALNGSRRRLDVRPLVERLRQPADMAFAFYVDKATMGLLGRKNVPSLCLEVDECDVCGTGLAISSTRDEAFAALTAHCRRAGVRHVLLAGYGIYRELARMLKSAGAAVETYSVPDKSGYGYLEEIQRDAMKAFIARFRRSGRRLPDLVVVTDDFVARGVLAAFSELGIRCPDDVRLVAAVNKGFGPVYPRTLARIETDPWRDAETFAAAAISYMDGKSPSEVVSSVRYTRGATFP